MHNYILLLVALLVGMLYFFITTPEGRSKSLQKQREMANPEYYILQNIKDK